MSPALVFNAVTTADCFALRPTSSTPAGVCLSVGSYAGMHPTMYSYYVYGWPEPYIYTIYDRIFGDFPAKNTVYTPYIYGSGQP